MRSRAYLGRLILFFCCVAAAPGQENIRVRSTLVVVPVTVTDSRNRFVLGLDKTAFTVLEDGAEQKITQFAGEDAPVSAGLLVDVSGSMGAKIALSRQAVEQFLKTMEPNDEASLVEFGDQAKIIEDFTPDGAAIEKQLSQLEPQGLTALLDAVSLGLGEMKKAKNARKTLVIISDGGDNNSRYSAAQIEELVRQADVQVYSMGVFDRFSTLALSTAELSGPKLLTELSEQTGGRVYPCSKADDLPAIAARIAIELRNQYVLAYAPSNSKRDGNYRKITVKVKTPPGLSGLKVRWRPGYYASSD